MSRSADVVVPVYRDVTLTRACLESVLTNSGESLRRLIVVDDVGPDPEMRPMLESLRARDGRVRLLFNEQNLGFVGSANRGLSVRQGDVVLLNSDTEVTAGWLDELLGVLHDHERIAAVTPLSNNATLASVPTFGAGVPVSDLKGRDVDLRGLPRWSETPTGVGFCLAMRGELLDLLGLFDPAYGRGYNEENDWCQRARALGFLVVRANRCLVFHFGEVSFQGARAELDEHNARRLVARYPSYVEQNRDFEAGPHARVAAIAVAAQVRRLRVGLDLSHLVAPDIHGTAVYGTQLARALASREGLELTVRVASPTVAAALAPAGVRCVEATGPFRDVELVHAPTQVYDEATLRALLESEGHLVFTWQDLIALRAPEALGTFDRSRRFRSLTWAALTAAQGVVAISDTAASELVALMPGLSGRLARTWLGFDTARVPSTARVDEVTRARSLTQPYVVHAGSDYPHKNLEWLLEAWPLVTSGVELVLVGPRSRLPNTLGARGAPLPARVRHLGELPSDEVLPVVAGARAVVLPSVYEGFGLGALEAMAVEVPVIISGLSAVAEVADAAAAVPPSLTPSSLARTVDAVVTDPTLRRKLVAAGRARARTFSWAETAKQTEAFYRQIVLSPDAASLDARDALRRLLA
ncbi:MAG: glycosyltransferase [Myxococcaceae bacterium]|nr:glycosyltransferase [Myxococcaceae bacterium]